MDVNELDSSLMLKLNFNDREIGCVVHFEKIENDMLYFHMDYLSDEDLTADEIVELDERVKGIITESLELAIKDKLAELDNDKED